LKVVDYPFKGKKKPITDYRLPITFIRNRWNLPTVFSFTRSDLKKEIPSHPRTGEGYYNYSNKLVNV
jgi:hypothetical protein